MTKELPSSVEDSPDWASDSQAREEEQSWPDEGKLKGAKQENKIAFIKTIGFITPIVMWIFTSVFLVSFVSWSLHFLLPDYCHWLTEDQLSKIQSIIFSGAMGAIVSSYLKKQMD